MTMLCDTLAMNERQAHALLAIIPDALCHISGEGVLLGYKDSVGITPGSTMIGRNLFDVLLAPVAAQLREAMQRARETGAVQICEYQVRIGETECMSETHIILSGNDEFLCLIRDITKHKQTAQTLLQSEQRLRMVISNVPTVLFALDRDGIFILSDGRGLQVLGLQPGQIVGLSVFDVYHNEPQILPPIRRALTGEAVTFINDMGHLIFETQLTPLFDQDGRPNGVIGLATDISARVKAESALQVSERRFRALTENASDLVLILDAAGIYRYASPSHQRILGYSAEELLGTSIFNLFPEEDLAIAFASFTHSLQTNIMERRKCRLRHANGSVITVEYVGQSCFDDPAIEGFVINAHDVTERNTMEKLLRYQVSYDMLTDLPNRATLLERLEETIAMASLMHQDKTTEVALLTMDLDRFKEINDTFGHHHGDILLQQLGGRLRALVSENATVARLGGDEFALLFPTTDETHVQRTVAAIVTLLEEPFIIEDLPLQVQTSIGVALYPTHGADALTLLRRADVAMYTAKQAHLNCVVYDPAHDTYSPRRLALMGALRKAIANNELKLYYQPKVEIETGEVHSVEALVRWQHPEFGFVPPDQFIPLAEQTGLIIPLTLWVLETAARQCSEWLHGGLELSVAVNLSMWDLHELTLPDTIGALLKRYALSAHLLRVELTESVVMTDVERTLDILTRLAELGIQISVDDFGTGYSSLAYLKRMPITELKIDRSFVMHMANTEVDATIVQSTITMAHGLGLKVVAEGVEDEKTWHLLSNFKCDVAQGYYMSRPVSAQDLETWVRKERA